jgi:hypothetical protein
VCERVHAKIRHREDIINRVGDSLEDVGADAEAKTSTKSAIGNRRNRDRKRKGESDASEDTKKPVKSAHGVASVRRVSSVMQGGGYYLLNGNVQRRTFINPCF